MKPPLLAALYGGGLLLAFGVGWFFKPEAFADNAIAPSHPALPVKRPGPPIPQKQAGTLAASRQNWLHAALEDAAAVRAAMQPGVENQVLLDKLRAVLGLQDETTRLTRWRALMETMRPEDAPAVKALWWSGLAEGRASPDEQRAFWHQWGLIDPKAAVTMATTEYFTSAVPDILAGWARINPEAALTWLRQNPNAGPRPQEAIKAMTAALAADSKESAIRYIRAHADDTFFQESLGMEIDCTVREKGLTAAKEAFAEIARSALPGAYKIANLARLQSNWAKAPSAMRSGTVENDDMMEVSRQYLGESWFSSSMAQYLSGQIAGKDPASGVPDLERFTNPKAKEAFATNLFDQWSRKNPGSLSEWLTVNRGHENFDLAAFRLVVSTSQADSEAAHAWAAEIKDPKYLDSLQEILAPQPPPK